MSNNKPNSFLFLVYLAGLSIIGFLATDMYLPAFDKMRIDLGTTKSNISLSLSLFLGGYAIAQLIWGPISEKFGKPKTILTGLGIFTISSLIIYFTDSVALLLALRLIQAIGVCAAAVTWQTLVIEKYPAEETNKVFASIMPLVALSPALAPLLGVYLLNQFGWRSIFISLAVIAILLIAYTFTITEEKKDEHKEIEATENKSYFSLLKSKKYVGNVLIYAICSGAFFAWLTGSTFFLKEMGYTESQIGLSFVPQTISFLIGGYGYRFISHKVESYKIMPFTIALYSIGATTLYLLSVFTEPSLTTLLIPFCLMALTNGANYPIVVAEALKSFPNNTGKAAALQNTIQLGVCFITSAIVSIFTQDALLTTTIVMGCTVPFMYLGFRLSRK
ncbi:purine nucleoside transporter PunC [Myroides phaeus]|uniref:Drug resistance transporter, Bcr/CflA subfamily n=1 Tax=Myroides phaeus TaxID=702745 RepID=A0A1G8GBL7_9FLAO|nr:purine nucleoside transporter PunC [Myroides phaeus]SDH91788.1 drug resistance transporter, Bcr/CflA subfamily [Myroides phaeus]